MTRILFAVSQGYLLKQLQEQKGYIHSVFQQAVNLMFERQMVTLLRDNQPNVPQGICINYHHLTDWRDVLTQHQRISMNAHTLASQKLIIKLQQATILQPSRHYRLNWLSLTTLLPKLKQTLFNYCYVKRLENCEQLASIFCQKETNVLRLNKAQLADKLARLIGFGQELTPDGDDFLVGYLAGFLQQPTTQLNRDLKNHLALIMSLIPPKLNQTNTISRLYLSQALQGDFSETIHQLVESLSHIVVNEEDVMHKATLMMQIGATSGTSSLLGLIYSFQNQLH